MSASYPNMLASGLTLDATFTPFELWAGESDLVTSQGTAGATLQQFQVVMRDAAGLVVPWAGYGGVSATDTITFSTAVPAASDSVTINGTTITFRTSGATGYDVNIPGTLVLTAQAVRDMVNLHEDVFGCSAAVLSGSVVTLTATEGGEAGNVITLSKSGTNIAVGGATFSAGTDAGRRPIGFTAQAAVIGGPAVFYTGGVPNHEALVWPAAVTTLTARKAAFDGTNITVSSLL